MRTVRTPTLILAALSLTLIAAPVASAEPDCVQVYPWSELCQGDVDGFLEAVAPEVCDLKDCVVVSPPPMHCLDVYPWSELCQGDVVGFACYYLRCDAILA